MSTLISLGLCGAAGGFIFEWFGLPGGAMTGAIIAVILLKSFSSLPQAAFPRPFQFCIYAGLGVLVGNMYRPEMLLAVRDTWPVLVISTLLVLVAGMLIAIFVVKFGNLDVTSAYLATSPGGLNVVVGLAADMGPNAPIVLAYQMVRLYTIILTERLENGRPGTLSCMYLKGIPCVFLHWNPRGKRSEHFRRGPSKRPFRFRFSRLNSGICAKSWRRGEP